MIKKITIVLFFLFSLVFFYKINDINYEKHNEIKKLIINHPENLPTKNFARATSFGFQNLKADYYWLKTVQYIGANAFHSEYKKYLYEITDLVTELNPFFESPYFIGMLLLPAYEARYEFITEEENEVHINEAEEIGLKAIENFCNIEKVNLVANEYDLIKIWNNKEYSNPCKTYLMPFQLAYVYFNYKNNPLEASKYYKIASACEDTPDGAKTLAAIMAGKGGNREKSFFMFLTMALVDKNEDEICNIIGNELYNVGIGIFGTKEIHLDSLLVKNINERRKEAFSDSEDNNNILKATECKNNINKAVRELNLEYIKRIYDKYIQDNNTEPIYTAKDLYDKGYLEYLPIDYQKYDEYGIIYILNKSTGNFDYMLGNY